MKHKILFTLSLFMLLCAANFPSFSTPTVKMGEFRSGYVPVFFDYVLPQSFATFSDVTYVNWGVGTGLPSPYSTYFSIMNRRCRVQSNPFTIAGGTQLYVNLLIVGTTYTVMWPVNEVNPYGTTDYLIKTT